MIKLDKYEKQWILLIKGQLSDKYPYTGTWTETLKPLFIEIYGWNPDEDNNYHDYLRGVFNDLLDIHLKIKDNSSDENGQLKEIFFASFYESIFHNHPIERAISKLCGIIKYTSVVDSDGIKRFDLF